MAEQLPAGKIKIAESGISEPATVHLFKENGFNGFLMGENFMKAADPGQAFAKFARDLKNFRRPGLTALPANGKMIARRIH